MRLPVVALAVLVCVFTSNPARADLITISSTSFGLGVDVSQAFEGVTLQRLDQPNPTTNTYAAIALPVITSAPFYGPLDVSFGGYDGGFGSYNWCYLLGQGGNETNTCSSGFWSVLEVTFEAPTHYVQIVGDSRPGLEPLLHAYSSDGALIMTCSPWSIGPGCGIEHTPLEDDNPSQDDQRSTLSLTLDQRDIARVVWGGGQGGADAHQISYAVPEPSALLLIGIGGVGLVIRRKRFPSAQ